MKIIRMFDVFCKNSNQLVDEIVIPNLDVEVVKKLIDLKKGDINLYYQYEVKGKLKEHFENIGYNFQTDNFDYFLSCYQDN
ncbi:DUF7683 domain-containing protein [Mesonia mobilis]|uniref:DUF7683 domain-containing protein n=1 Tax=Mesonia mobilis TaxID=369791 RepID=A0ABQ3C1X7_9FLAO|nr:hypothetical protein [Mesonia mobilis]GGZ64814.1 hypothetical protein GCM10008088_27850 [Mesonia mobilis]